MLRLCVLFVYISGGAENLFDKIKSRTVSLDASKVRMYFGVWTHIYMFLYYIFYFISGTIKDLIFWMRDNILTDRPELFLQNDSVLVKMCLCDYAFLFISVLIDPFSTWRRPGILVLVNDADWELMVKTNL